MKLLHSPVARRLFLLAILLGVLFLMHPLQQTAFAATTCCTTCDANFETCSANCDPSIPSTCNICNRIYARCESTCNHGC